MRTRFAALLAVAVAASVTTLTPADETKKAALPKAAGPTPQMKTVLDQLAALDPRPVTDLTPAAARKQPSPADAVKALLKKQGKTTDPEPVGGVKDRTIPGPAGAIPARVYTPKGDGPFPVVVYWHGGGWVLADLDTYDASARALCNAASAVVVACDYRHAPEHPFPAAADDAFAAYQWVRQNAAAVGGDPTRVAVAGESAGGNLAAGVCLKARDRNVAAPVHQLLVYPVTNNNLETASYREHADAKPLNRAMMRWFFAHYLGNQPAAATSPYAFPLKATDLSRLPPATVLTADIDPLRSDGELYAAALKTAGVPVTYKNYVGVVHEFFGMGAVLDDAKKAVADGAAGLQSGFGKKADPKP